MRVPFCSMLVFTLNEATRATIHMVIQLSFYISRPEEKRPRVPTFGEYLMLMKFCLVSQSAVHPDAVPVHVVEVWKRRIDGSNVVEESSHCPGDDLIPTISQSV